MGKWIPIQEKLPELHKHIDRDGNWNESDPVLIIGEGTFGQYNLNGKDVALAQLYSEDEPNENGELFNDGVPCWTEPEVYDNFPIDGGKYGKITHWMPFPKVPTA